MRAAPPSHREQGDNMRWLGSLAVFVLTLAVLKFFFGWNISIAGSVVLTLILTGISMIFNRART